MNNYKKKSNSIRAIQFTGDNVANVNPLQDSEGRATDWYMWTDPDGNTHTLKVGYYLFQHGTVFGTLKEHQFTRDWEPE